MLICIIYIDGDFNELLIRMLDIHLNIGLVNKERERERERERENFHVKGAILVQIRFNT